jgi:hypothetical protein
MLMLLLWPVRQAIKFQEDLLSRGTIYSPPIRPPVAEINEPSEDHESLLLMLIVIDYLKYAVICVSSVRFLKF